MSREITTDVILEWADFTAPSGELPGVLGEGMVLSVEDFAAAERAARIEKVRSEINNQLLSRVEDIEGRMSQLGDERIIAYTALGRAQAEMSGFKLPLEELDAEATIGQHTIKFEDIKAEAAKDQPASSDVLRKLSDKILTANEHRISPQVATRAAWILFRGELRSRFDEDKPKLLSVEYQDKAVFEAGTVAEYRSEVIDLYKGAGELTTDAILHFALSLEGSEEVPSPTE